MARIIMKRTLLLVALMAMASTTFAQLTHTTSGAVDVTASKIMQQASQKFTSGAVAFQVAYVAKDAQKKETMRTSAQVTYHAGKYKVQTGNQQIFSDGSSTWHYNGESNEVVVTAASNAQHDLMNPADLIAHYDKSFRAKFIRQEADGTAVIDLTPRSASSYHKVRLYVNSKTHVVSRVEAHGYDGSRSEFDISKFRSVKANDADYTFNPARFPHVEVIDMR